MALQKQFVQGWTTAFKDVILAEVLHAVAGIPIFGVKPFSGLQAWSDALMQQASDAFSQAQHAQTSADSAQASADTAVTTANATAQTVETVQGDVADLQSKTQQLLDVVGYGCTYMNSTVNWNVHTAGAKQKMNFATQVGPIVGCSLTNGAITLNSKGLWRVDLQMTFANIVVVSGAIDMDIRVYAPDGTLFTQKFFHDDTGAYITRTNIFSFVTPAAGYRVEAWAGAAFGRNIVGGQPTSGLNVVKISGETS